MNQMSQPCCPDCLTHTEVIPFFYGLPSLHIIMDAQAGKIALGDASLWPDRPTHTCKTCSTEFNTNGKTGVWKNPFVYQSDNQVAA